ncbi:MAG: hypothetical protein OYK82_05705 [Gammaproteobacteria bacterium]|nr:hypothetical protein [Gammaproteobacteria bacterium]
MRGSGTPYGIHLTPGLAEVSIYVAGMPSFLAGFCRFRVEGLAGIAALKAWQGVLPSCLLAYY